MASRADKIVVWAMFAALVASVMAFLPGLGSGSAAGFDRYCLPKEAALVVVGAIGAAVCLARAWRIRICLADACLLGYLALGLLSTLGATNRWMAWRALALSAAGVSVYWCARCLAARGAGAWILRAAALAVTIGAVAVVAEAHGVLPRLSMDGRAPGAAVGNRNFMAHFLVIGLPVIALASVVERRRSMRLAALAAVSVVVCAVVLSRSRGAWLGMSGAVIVSALMVIVGRRVSVRKLVRRGSPLLIAAACGGCLAVGVPNQLQWRSGDPFLTTLGDVVDYQSGTGFGRLVQYERSLDMAWARPVLGVGPGNWSVEYPRHSFSGDPSYRPIAAQPVQRLPNSDVYGLLAERGFAGFGLLVAALALIARGLWRLARGRGRTVAVGIAGLASMAACSVVGTFDAVLLRSGPTLLVFAVLGATVPRATPVARIAFGPRACVAAVACVLAVGGAALVHSGAQIKATYLASARPGTVANLEAAARLTPEDFRLNARLAYLNAHRGRCREATTYARRTLEFYPHHDGARRVLAECE